MQQARYSLDPPKRRQLFAEGPAIIHEEKPWLELFQEVVVYGVSKRLQFKPRADYRLIVSEMTLARQPRSCALEARAQEVAEGVARHVEAGDGERRRGRRPDREP